MSNNSATAAVAQGAAAEPKRSWMLPQYTLTFSETVYNPYNEQFYLAGKEYDMQAIYAYELPYEVSGGRIPHPVDVFYAIFEDVYFRFNKDDFNSVIKGCIVLGEQQSFSAEQIIGKEEVRYV